MNRHLAIAAVISGLAFAGGCSDDKSSDSTTPATSPGPTTTTVAVPVDETIAGTIFFDGDVGSGVIIVVANLVGSNEPPLYSAVLDAAGPYALTGVADGEYVLTAFLDAGDDRGPPEAGEPQGTYDPNTDGTPDSVVITGGVGLIAIDITLV
ncbi:MAG: hypothetical protein ABL953_08785 [Ilumatobacteraceae bacterium]